MVPGRCPETPWSLPGASQEPVQAGFQTQSKINEKFENSGSPPGRPGRLPGDPEGPPKSTKDRFFAKNGIQNANFCRFLCGKPFFVFCTWFFFVLPRKIVEKSTKKAVHFFTAALVFFNMPTLTKPCILQYESNFFTFWVFVFFAQKVQKNDLKDWRATFDPKNAEKRSPGISFFIKFGPELTSESQKSRKWRKKVLFWPSRFSTLF